MNDFIPQEILGQAEKDYSSLRAVRHALHSRPELSFQERETQQYLTERLHEYGVDDLTAVAGTGLLARLVGISAGPVIVLRADMDALPVTEENEVPYRSRHDGVMHACGHDVHMTCLLGTAALLSRWRSRWRGTVLFLFQPAEEKLPGGAKTIVESGTLDRYHPSLVIGQHVDPSLPAGAVGYRPGRYMASTDELYLTVSGRGGHAALPSSVTNTPYIAAKILTALEEFVERNTPAAYPSVLRFGKVSAAGATNIIPPEVRMEGTFRTFDETWRHQVHKEIQQISSTLAKRYQGRATLEIKKGYPVLINDEQAVSSARSFSEDLLGKENVIPLELRMTAEDFAYYSHRYPSLFFRLGTSAPGVKEPFPLHSPHFDIHEPALITGTAHLTWLTLSFLKIFREGK
jgi:amidohydrolase